jgi:CRISPR-associated protein Cas2
LEQLIHRNLSLDQNEVNLITSIRRSRSKRVQLSVFECRVNEAQYEAFRAQLLSIMDSKIDNLRIYKLSAPRDRCLECYGIDKYVDFDEPLIL